MTDPNASGGLAKLGRLARSSRNAGGAVTAQLVQALASLVLSIAVSRSLGAEGLGVFGLLTGGLILGTALCTGLVGDSLTVLDRRDPSVRAGLQRVGFSAAFLAGLIGVAVATIGDLLTPAAAIVFGFACSAFIVEEYLRRTLMASMRFWSVTVVDLTTLIVSASVLVVAAGVGTIDMTTVFGAMLLAQLAGMVTAFLLLPDDERYLVSRRHPAAIRAVFEFGGWRAAQQAVRPAMLTLMRVIVVIAVGTAIYGGLEAARVYTAPALLFVNGIGGFLFSRYAAEHHRPIHELVRVADLGAIAMSIAAITVGVIGVIALPYADQLITGDDFPIPRLAVVGWSAYAAAAALLMPYGSLAAVTGMHARVLVLRVVESVVSLTAVIVVAIGLGAPVGWVPIAMSVGPLVLGLFLRHDLLARGSTASATNPSSASDETTFAS